MIQRCTWCSNDPIYQAYHDYEWGHPVHQAHPLFEMLCLEGQQAGLAWITVLKKRAAYRTHFFQYSIAEIAQFTDAKLDEKLHDKSLIRHRGKIYAIRHNAQAWLKLQLQYDMVKWLWQFIALYPDQPQRAAQHLSTQLKQHGFKFVGSKICFAFIQATGMINDHDQNCDFKN